MGDWDRVVTEAASTNDLAREAALQGAPHGAWMSARRQTSGRGRLGRAWESLEGNLFFSMVARIERRELWSWIPLTTGVAAAAAIESVAPGLAVRLKWPNDLRIGEAKLGGILCEAAADFVVLGIGINCAEAPEGLDQPVTSLSAESGRRIGADQLRPALVASLREWLGSLEAEVSRAVRAEYERRASFAPGSRVEWAPGSAGEVVGLGEHGELLVRVAGGRVEPLYAEDVTGTRRASGGSPA